MTKTTEMTNNNELNEMELNQVNGGCDSQPAFGDIVQCKGCGEYYLTKYGHICFEGAVVDRDPELLIDLTLFGEAAAQE